MKVLKADFKSKDAANTFVSSCRDTGFGAITNHPIQKQLIDDVYSEWKDFFASESKFDYLYNKQTQAGYFPMLSENAKGFKQKDLKEFFHVYPNQVFPKTLSDKTIQLRDQLYSLGRTLLQWLDDLSPDDIKNNFSMPLAKMADGSPKNLFRIIHYPPIQDDIEPGAIRAAAHEDINLITLLPASTAMGLQVKDKEGNWYNVPGDYGDIVVNVGDMLQMASQGFYKSTTHQVINPEGSEARKARFSMPLFVHPHSDVRLSEKHTAGSYLQERLEEIGLK